MERTTGEIQLSIKRTSIEPAVVRQFLALLDESDLVKFSKFKPDTDEARNALQLGRVIVEKTMPSEEATVEPGSSSTSVKNLGEVTDSTASTNGNYQKTEVQA